MDEAVVKEEVIEETHNFMFKSGEYVEVKQEEVEQKPEHLLEEKIKTEPIDFLKFQHQLEELTFDYGAKYIEEHLKNNCLCGRVSCKSSPLYKMMDEANEESLEMYQTLRYHYRYDDYKTKVLDPTEEKVAAGTSSI
ncbi:hypothetical protein B9Z55_028234 [Caenorhabditis nigoni]|uniref:Uncharacterized protein n=1 Tax=Caenorhabditis nigoni TaxID=1611254 RepID=A0A2G5SCT1_9PELO|nr:hypothetical protein B9Z55_028234 [Caenorhabditis nigoni]